MTRCSYLFSLICGAFYVRLYLDFSTKLGEIGQTFTFLDNWMIAQEELHWNYLIEPFPIILWYEVHRLTAECIDVHIISLPMLLYFSVWPLHCVTVGYRVLERVSHHKRKTIAVTRSTYTKAVRTMKRLSWMFDHSGK